MSEVIWLWSFSISGSIHAYTVFRGRITRKAAEYGNPMGRLANIANSRFAIGLLNARLWEISWMAKKRFWLAVAPIT